MIYKEVVVKLCFYYNFFFYFRDGWFKLVHILSLLIYYCRY